MAVDEHVDPHCAVAHGAPDPESAPVPERTLVAVFASPVAEYLLRYGQDLGYRVVLFDPDPARSVAGFAAVSSVDDVKPDELTEFVVTDHHRDDLGTVLRDVLAVPSRWVGLMGNPRHVGPHHAALAALDVPPDVIARVHRPIGLNIGSRQPAEIAISTLAGLIAERNGRDGGFF